jgi:PhnB protein
MHVLNDKRRKMPEVADSYIGGAQVGVGNGAAAELQSENGTAALKQLPGVAAITYAAATPYLLIESPKAAEALAFYKKAFGAEEVSRVYAPKRKAEQEEPPIRHAHIRFGGTNIYLADEPEVISGAKSPATLNGTSFILHLSTSDVDAAVARAVEAGAKVGAEVADQDYGERYGMILDPYGYSWGLCTPIIVKDAQEVLEKETPDEVVRAA